MSTVLEIVEDIIVNHEKQEFSTVSTQFKNTVAEAVNRAIRYLYNYADWTFRLAQTTDFIYFNIAEGDSPLPDDFLSFNQTGAVFYNSGERPKELTYIPLPEMVRLLYGTQSTVVNNPKWFSLGGPIATGEHLNQRQLFVYPNPQVGTVYTLDLIYQAVAPGPYTSTDDAWEEEIDRIPINWHYVIREMAIIFRLIDKEGDSSRYQDLLKTCMKTMVEQEPHGRENTNISLPKKLFRRMSGRFR